MGDKPYYETNNIQYYPSLQSKTPVLKYASPNDNSDNNCSQTNANALNAEFVYAGALSHSLTPRSHICICTYSLALLNSKTTLLLKQVLCSLIL